MSRITKGAVAHKKRATAPPKNTFALLLVDDDDSQNNSDEETHDTGEPTIEAATVAAVGHKAIKGGNAAATSSSTSGSATLPAVNRLLLLPDSILTQVILPLLDDSSAVSLIGTHQFLMRFKSAYRMKSEVEYRLLIDTTDRSSNDTVVIRQEVAFPVLAQSHSIGPLNYIDDRSYQPQTYPSNSTPPVGRIGLPTHVHLKQVDLRTFEEIFGRSRAHLLIGKIREQQQSVVQPSNTLLAPSATSRIVPSSSSSSSDLSSQSNNYEGLNSWLGKIFDHLPATIESLRIASDLCITELPAMAHFTRLHTLEFEMTILEFFTLPSGHLPPNLRILKYGDLRHYHSAESELPPDQINFPQTLTELYLPPNVFSAHPYSTDPNVLKLPPQLRVLHYPGQTHSLKDWSLPESLTELRLGDTFNDDSLNRWTPPKRLQTLLFGAFFSQDISHVVWPSNLTKVVFGHNFAQSLLTVTFPPSLTHLEVIRGHQHYSQQLESLFGRGDQKPESMILPPMLQTFIVPRKSGWCQECWMTPLVYPSTLTHLELGDRQHTDYTAVRWSDSIRYLQLSAHHIIWVNNFPLPKRLQVLVLTQADFGENKPLLPLTLPSTLRELTLDDSFNNSSIEKLTLPDGLTKLTFGERFNRSLKKVRLPSSLTYFALGREWDQHCTELPIFPSGLRTLIFGDRFAHSLTIKGFKFPSSLRYLSFGAQSYLQDLSGLELPSGLRELHFASRMAKYIDQQVGQLRLPKYCRVIRTFLLDQYHDQY